VDFLESQSFKRRAIKTALSSPNKEVCGIFKWNEFNTALDFMRFENASCEENFFLVNSKHFYKLYKDNEVFCLFHSHPSTSDKISDLDIEISESLMLPSYIFSNKTKECSLYFPQSYTPPDLMGRPFIPELQDCVILFKDYFKLKLNIDLSKQYTDWCRKFKDSNAFLINQLDEHFEPINAENLEAGDLIIFNPDIDRYFHIGIYDGNDNFLHHPSAYLSKIELLTDKHRSNVYNIYRYKG